MSEKVITYRDYSNGDIEICRDLCNSLMQHQANMGKIHKDVLGAMTFDTRLKPSFESTKDKLVLVAFDGDKAIGYVYASADHISEGYKNARPVWNGKVENKPEYVGFVPADVEVGTYFGEINNIFLYPEYRGLNVGKTLMDKAMEWIKAHEGVECAFVYVSNGNNAGTFYEKYGFRYVADVMDGIIKTYKVNF